MNHLVVCEDAEAAAYLHNTVESLTGALDLFYFPASFKNKKNYRLLNSSHVMLRTEALTRLSAAMRQPAQPVPRRPAPPGRRGSTVRGR